MLNPKEAFRDYQKDVTLQSLSSDETMLWMGMGLGKTVIALTNILERIRSGEVKKALVFGPIAVVSSVWHVEAKKWSHTKDLRFSSLMGTKDQRTRALFRDADIYLCNYELMNWLAETLVTRYIKKGIPFPFDMVVYDEISYLQSSTSLRLRGGDRDRKDGEKTKKVKYYGWDEVMMKFAFKMGLTGTPTGSGYIDLHGQYLVMDGGKRLGTHITHYRNAYFIKQYEGWGSDITPSGKKWIEHKISDITINMETRDYLDLPPVTVVDHWVTLPPNVMEMYETFEKSMFIELEMGILEVDSKISAACKCRQLANGSVYLDREEDLSELVHEEKLKALDTIVKEANGHSVLVLYQFTPDYTAIMARYKKLKPERIHAKNAERVIRDWKAGKIKMLLGHPKSMGFGLDGLQEGGRIVVWFGLPYSNRDYNQANARLDRSGQKSTVCINRILTKSTVDVALRTKLMLKQTDEKSLRRAIQEYRIKKNRGELVYE